MQRRHFLHSLAALAPAAALLPAAAQVFVTSGVGAPIRRIAAEERVGLGRSTATSRPGRMSSLLSTPPDRGVRQGEPESAGQCWFSVR